MILQLNKEMLETRLKGAQTLPIGGAILASCAREILGMALAYHDDGITFLSRGDQPNALASFSYALGWLDAGSCLGLIASESCGLPLEGSEKGSRGDEDVRLSEKTGRYRDLLGTAIERLHPAPEYGSCLHDGGERFLMLARVLHELGEYYERSGDVPSALAAYSYGFGWLDAGVRTGLFTIRNSRELFTI
jgi:hypothetical protein